MNSETRILMVEDDSDHAYLAKLHLEKKSSHTVVIAQSPDDCLNLLSKQRFDIILLDYHLPDENGLAILKRIKRNKLTDAPIVVVTGHGHEKIAVAALKAGAFDYVVKSADYPAILPNVVKRVLEKYQIFREKKRMEAELFVRNNELQVLNAISQALNQSLILKEILRDAIDTIASKLDFAAGGIYLSESQGNLVLKAGVGVFNEFEQLHQSELREEFRTAEDPWIVNDVTEDNSDFTQMLMNRQIKSVLCLPLRYNAKFLGVLIVGSTTRNFFAQRHINLLNSISSQISIAIENANLYLQTKKLKNNLQNVFNSSLDLIITLGADERIKFYNEKFAEFYGDSANKIIGKEFLNFIPDASKNQISEKLAELRSGAVSIYETELMNARGSTIPCLISQSLLKGRDEYLMVIKDISRIVQLQKQLMQTEKLSSMGQMIAGVAHELNNPLAGVIGYSQLLLSEKLDHNVRNDVKVILKEAKRCQIIVKNLLTFARKQNTERELIHVNEVLNNVLELQSYQFKGDAIRYEKDFDPTQPQIIGDQHQLQQVFLHLIRNAQQALQTSPKALKILIVRTEKSRDLVRVRIEDNGVGISEEAQNRIFDPFFTTREVGEGTGLGLSICFGIIQSHQGELMVESALNHGTTFVIELPILVDDQAGFSGETIPATDLSKDGKAALTT